MGELLLMELRMGVEEGHSQCPVPPQALLQMTCQQAQDWGTKILGVKGGKKWGDMPKHGSIWQD